jgi:hypothetical protein
MTQEPRNLFHQNLAVIEGRQQALAERVAEATAAMPSTAGIETQLSALSGALVKSAEAQTALGALQAEALGRVACATEAVGDLLATQLDPARDAPTILLYLGVGPHGGFDQHSNLGQLLIRACGEKRPGLAWLFYNSKVRKSEVMEREAFVGSARNVAASSPGLETIWSDYDFGRFHDLAPHVWRLIEVARSAWSDPTSEGTAQ